MKKSHLMLGAATLALSVTAQAEDATPSRWTADEIIVTGQRQTYAEPQAATATRTATPVEKVPQSIQTLTRALLEDQDQRTLTDALVNVSGTVPSSTMQIVLQPTLVRGFTVNYYFDGMPTYQLPAGVADPATLANVERIEVAKGPTSTLYGGGTGAPLSGLINVVSRDPSPTFGGSVALRAGSQDTRGGDASINLPLSDTVAVRLDGMVEDAESHIDHIDAKRHAFFPTLSWAATPDTRLVVRGRYSKLEQQEYAGLPAALTAPTLVIDRDTYAGGSDQPRTEVENKQLSGFLSHSFSDTLEANLAVSRFENNFEEWGSFPYGRIAGTTYNFGTAYLPSNTDKTFATASLLARFDTGTIKHQVLAGADYDNTDYFGAMYFNAAWATLDYAAANPTKPFGGKPPLSFDQNDEMSSRALFVQDQIAIGDHVDVTVGLRWTDLEVSSNVGGAATTDKDKRITPRVGATVKLVDGLSAFAGYAEGFQGVVAGGFYSIVPKPETSQSYEGGFKFAAPVKGLTGTLAAYRIARQNVLTAHPTIPFAYVQTGEQRSKGIELDLVYEPMPALSLLATYTFTDAEVTKDSVTPVGSRLRAVPRHAGRLAARYRFQEEALKGLEIGGGVTAVSARELTLPNTVSVGGMTLADAQASYDFQVVNLSLSVVNLFNRKGFEPYQYLGGAYVAPVRPRSAFVTLRKNF